MSSYSGCGWDLQVLNNNLDWNASASAAWAASHPGIELVLKKYYYYYYYYYCC